MGEEGVNLERESESDVCGGRGSCFVMDTPDRKQFTSPASKFEDSPVFNYLNSLSPIKPLKSIHITQTFNSLTFSSPPSVFTSPHVSSLKDSTFLRRHQYSDSSKPKFSYNHGDEGDKSEEATEVTHNSEQQQSYDPGFIAGESSALPVYESSDAVALPQTLSDESVSPDRSRTSRLCIENKFVPGLAVSSSDLLPYAQVDSGKESLGEDVHVEGTSLINEIKGASGCDWENLFSDEGDLILFNTPNESKSLMHPGQISLEHGTSFCTSLTGDLQNSQAVNTIGSSQQHETDNNSPLVDGRHDMKEVKNQDILVSCSNSLAGDRSEKVNDQIASNLHRGMRRRCLVFEMIGSRRKRLDDASDCVSSVLSQSTDNAASNDKHVLSLNSGNDNPRRILHGIGLHLNALAATSVDHRVIRHEASATGEQPISVSGPSAYFNLSNSQQISNNSFATSLDRDVCPVEDGAPIAEDAAQGSGYMVNEMLNHCSPKKKRRRSDNDGESEACKRCNCKKSKCLKLYCECFAAGVYCVEPCSCQECFNTPIHEDTVLATRKLIESRNPLAFAPKVIRNSDSMIEIGEESSNTPASARHKRGCNCKKSGCLKKYCECYQGGVGCSINCRCEGCKNAFGRKDGSEIELEDDEAEKIDELEGRAVNRNLKITTMVNDVEQNTNFTLPATPLQFGRQSIQPFSSKSKKPPRSFLSIEGFSCGIFGTPRFGKLNNLPPQAKFQNDQKDEMPEIFQQNASPNSSVKSGSPNSKRVSPPHSDIGLSPGRRSNRKLILQSISSFPSLTPKH